MFPVIILRGNITQVYFYSSNVHVYFVSTSNGSYLEADLFVFLVSV